jgi:hypothetical protein
MQYAPHIHPTALSIKPTYNVNKATQATQIRKSLLPLLLTFKSMSVMETTLLSLAALLM